MKLLGLSLFFFCFSYCAAQQQPDSSMNYGYRETPAKVNDLVHTNLRLVLDYKRAALEGKINIMLTPHFYATDSLVLDAKQMVINKVLLVSNMHALKYTYDGWKLRIKLDRTYRAKEKYSIYIEYTAKPGEAKTAANGYRGLYFINADEKIKNKPVQVWTDGEAEFTSYWCPTIDKPNQKATCEFHITVPEKYITVSNGLLREKHNNKDGTRTDHWVMNQPLPPYLFFMAIGDFAIVKDIYKGKEVSYYVEQAYASTARQIFGNTPQMIALFEKLTGVNYPWQKYAQVTLRDFTSTAMENTSITAHAEAAQQDARELKDGNRWENNIAHELFHQWFGDYVTCESWSNLALNESFATYGQYLWKEYHYGTEEAAEENHNQLKAYLRSDNEEKSLTRFYYKDQQDMFDEVSYEKGGVILHMLRKYLGDSAFFKGIHLYLESNKFKSAEVQHLRLAMEEVSGLDLNWYFNQWFYSNGHPKVTINYSYDDVAKKLLISFSQTQGGNHPFKLPVDIDIYQGAGKQRHRVWLSNLQDSFYFDAPVKPILVNADADKFLLWEKQDNKPTADFITQYSLAANYVDRLEALEVCAKLTTDMAAFNLVKTALKDKNAGIRLFAAQATNLASDEIKNEMEPILIGLAQHDLNTNVRLTALRKLAAWPKKNAALAIDLLNDSSYTVAGEALRLLTIADSAMAYGQAKRLAKQKAKGILLDVIFTTLIKTRSADDLDLITSKYILLPYRIRTSTNFADYVSTIHETEQFKKAIDAILYVRSCNPNSADQINKQVLAVLQKKQESSGLYEQASYIKSKLPQ